MTDPLSREIEATVRDIFSGGPPSKKQPGNGDQEARQGVDTARFIPLSVFGIVTYVAIRLAATVTAPPAMLATVLAHPIIVWVLTHQRLIIALLVVVVVIDGLRFNAFRHRVALRRLVWQTAHQQVAWVRVPWWLSPVSLASARIKLIRGSAIDDKTMAKLVAAVKHRYDTSRWEYTVTHRKDRLLIERARIVPDTRTDRHRTLQSALEVENLLPDAVVAVRSRDAAGGETGYRINFTPRLKLASEEYQAAIGKALITLAGDHESGHLWDVTWRADRGFVDLGLKAPLPTRVDHPLEIADDERLHVPYATGEADQLAVWNISTSSAAPHMLVIGPTGGGKTTLILSVITELVRRSIPVIGVDPKKIELDGIHDHPGVAAVIINPIRAALLVRALCTEMHARMDYVRINKLDAKELPMLVVVLDEFFILSAAWQRMLKSGDETTKETIKALDPLGAIADLGALSRSSGIRMLIGIQRPDAQIFGANSGSVRDNFKTRVSLSALSQDAAQMLWGDAQVGRNLDASIPGRATATKLNGDPMDAQVWWTPNLDRHPNKWNRMSAKDQALVTALTPDEGPAVTCYSSELAELLHEEQQLSLQTEIAAEPVLIGGRSLNTTPEALPDAIPAPQLAEGTTILVDHNGELVEATVLTVNVHTDPDRRRADGTPTITAVDVTAQIDGTAHTVTDRYAPTEAVFIPTADLDHAA